MASKKLYRSIAKSKICRGCRELKPREDYRHDDESRERSFCSACDAKRLAVIPKESNYKTVEERRAYRRQWAAKNPEKIRAYSRKHYRSNTPTEEQKARKSFTQKRRHLETKYGITPEQWDTMYAAQGGVCAVCKVPGRVGKHGKLAVDHCHTTGRIRGLLCTPCNVSIGILGETPEQWEVVWRYLRGE